MSSSFYTGKKTSLITHGYSRDHGSDRPQIVYGLLCDPEGRPITVEVFPGNTADPKAFTSIVTQVRRRFGITNVVFVGDRGMITTKRINEDLRDVDGLELLSTHVSRDRIFFPGIHDDFSSKNTGSAADLYVNGGSSSG